MPYQTSIDVNFKSENCSNSPTIIGFTNMQRAIQSPSFKKRKAPPPLESSDLNVSLLLRLSVDTLSLTKIESLTKDEKKNLDLPNLLSLQDLLLRYKLHLARNDMLALVESASGSFLA